MLLLTSRGPRCAPGPILPPSGDFVLVNSRTGIQWTSGASLIEQFAPSMTWGGLGGSISVPFTQLYRNSIISSGDTLGGLSVIETRDYSATTKAGWFDANTPSQWSSDGTDCTCTFTTSGWTIPGGSPHDSSYTITSAKRAARIDFSFTLGSDYQGHPISNKACFGYPGGSGLVYIDLNGADAGPYGLNLNVQGTVNPGNVNYSPNIVPGAAIERGVAVTVRFDLLGNTAATADGEMHLSYKLG